MISVLSFQCSKESAGVKAHGQKPNANKQQKLLCSKSLNRRLMPDISFKVIELCWLSLTSFFHYRDLLQVHPLFLIYTTSLHQSLKHR